MVNLISGGHDGGIFTYNGAIFSRKVEQRNPGEHLKINLSKSTCAFPGAKENKTHQPTLSFLIRKNLTGRRTEGFFLQAVPAAMAIFCFPTIFPFSAKSDSF